MTRVNRRSFITATGGVVTGGLLSASTVTASDHQEQGEEMGSDYEVWAVDQGTDTLYIYQPETPGRGDANFEAVETVDIGRRTEAAANTPHMLYFSSDDGYAAIPSTGAKGTEEYEALEDLKEGELDEEDIPAASTVVIDAAEREVVTRLETGPGSHFASFSPGDEYIIVDSIGDGAIKRIPFDGEDTPVDETEWDVIEVPGDLTEIENEGSDPVCHEYTGEGHTYHTLGPSYHDGALVIVDWDEFDVQCEFTREEIPANCGTIPDPERDQFFLTAGLPTPTDEEGEVIDPEGGVGEWYVFDTDEHRPIDTDGETVPESETFGSNDVARDSRGVDAHGLWLTDGTESSELWLVNRETNDGLVVQADDLGEMETVDGIGPAETDPREDPEQTDDRDSPDILWSSPDDTFVFSTLRGPRPFSGDPHASTGVNAGIAVWRADSRRRETVLEPAPEEELSDVHGIGVRER